ncbi:MAG: anaerobic ribonucleoside-triphosphate reductase activating protein [Oscillospiraceae bacterium]|nr:anaerobic ribonucleoside-triphosphate reductase activating protein [Oscillospiraceae bacterium]
MGSTNDLIINISALYRFAQKFFDKNLAPFNLGSGQFIYLMEIYEHEGISMQRLTDIIGMDKGTTTKSIKKLLDEGYIDIRADDQDKRVKRMYVTDKTAKIINDLYRIRTEFTSQILKDRSDDEILGITAIFNRMTRNAEEIVPEENYSQIKIGGLQKLTLLDYPGEVACTIFTCGCNMKCPFCHNRDLVFIPENFAYTDPDDIIRFLEKRQGILEAVCITGGEPLLQTGILDFLAQIKALGFKVKVDTNGLFPEKLKEIVESGFVDYVAMDIKNSLPKYCVTAGLSESTAVTDRIRQSLDYLMSDPIDHEFRTTVVRQFHTKEDLLDIAEMIRGTDKYYLQQFVDSGRCIEKGYESYSKAEMEEFRDAVRAIIPNVELRGL